MFKIEEIRLLQGSHSETAKTGSGCIMNVVAYLNGESNITDRPNGVCPIIRTVAIWLNDAMDDRERHMLLPFVSRIIGCRTDDRAEMWRRVNVLADKLESILRYRPTTDSVSVSWACDNLMCKLSLVWGNAFFSEKRRVIHQLMEALDEMLPNPEKQKSQRWKLDYVEPPSIEKWVMDLSMRNDMMASMPTGLGLLKTPQDGLTCAPTVAQGQAKIKACEWS